RRADDGGGCSSGNSGHGTQKRERRREGAERRSGMLDERVKAVGADAGDQGQRHPGGALVSYIHSGSLSSSAVSIAASTAFTVSTADQSASHSASRPERPAEENSSVPIAPGVSSSGTASPA